MQQFFSKAMTFGPRILTPMNPLPTGENTVPYVPVQLSATGGSPPYTWAFISGGIIAGLTLSPDGGVSGTPTQVGSSFGQVQITDSQGATSNAAPCSLTTVTAVTITTSFLPAGTQGAAYSTTLVAGGGASPYIWSLAGGTLPAGLSLSPGGVISGTPTGAETDTPLIQVTDVFGGVAQRSFSLNIVTNLAITTTSPLPSGTQGTAYSTTLAASGGTAPYVWTLSSGTLDSGLSLSSAGVISGTPANGEIDTLGITVTDAVGSPIAKTFSLTIAASGGSSLAITTPATLPNMTNGGGGGYPLSITGGIPPYTLVLNSSTGPLWTYDGAGSLIAAPVATGAGSANVTVSDATSASVTANFTVTIDNTLRFNRLGSGALTLPNGYQNVKYGSPTPQLTAAGGTNTGLTYSNLSGTPPTGLTLASSGAITGTITAAPGVYTWTVQVTDSGLNTATALATVTVLARSTVARPAYNSSAANGYYVVGTKLYDTNNNEFRLRGINNLHFDSLASSWAGGASGAKINPNCVRYWMGFPAFQTTTAVDLTTINNSLLANKILPILTIASTPGGGNTTGSSTFTSLGFALDAWARGLSGFSSIWAKIAVNVANEWGPSASQLWQFAHQRSFGNLSAVTTTQATLSTVSATHPLANSFTLSFAYLKGAGGITNQSVSITAIGGVSGAWTVAGTFPAGYTSGGTLECGSVGIVRATGYSGPIMMDAGGFGQSEADIFSYAAAVSASDPLQNCIFSYHLYGSTVPESATPIASIVSAGANTNIHLNNSRTDHHPWSVNFPGNNNWGFGSVRIAGVTGMVAINGIQTATSNPLGGVAGDWVFSIPVNSTGFGAATPGTGMLYGVSYFAEKIQRLAATGLCVVVGEFGPGQAVGPSPTNTSINDVISACEANSLGWMYWAWDDHGVAFSGWFGCTYPGTGHSSNVDLAAAGVALFYHPTMSLTALALCASDLL